MLDRWKLVRWKRRVGLFLLIYLGLAAAALPARALLPHPLGSVLGYAFLAASGAGGLWIILVVHRWRTLVRKDARLLRRFPPAVVDVIFAYPAGFLSAVGLWTGMEGLATLYDGVADPGRPHPMTMAMACFVLTYLLGYLGGILIDDAAERETLYDRWTYQLRFRTEPREATGRRRT